MLWMARSVPGSAPVTPVEVTLRPVTGGSYLSRFPYTEVIRKR